MSQQGSEDNPPLMPPADRPASSLTVGQLIGEIREQISLLVRKQIELARTEAKTDLRAEAYTAGGLGLAAIGAIITLALLFVTIILALSRSMPGWRAGLYVTGGVLLASVAAGVISWTRRIRSPLAKTRRALKDEIAWTKERFA
jgi:hypothetical protein